MLTSLPPSPLVATIAASPEMSWHYQDAIHGYTVEGGRSAAAGASSGGITDLSTARVTALGWHLVQIPDSGHGEWSRQPLLILQLRFSRYTNLPLYQTRQENRSQTKMVHVCECGVCVWHTWECLIGGSRLCRYWGSHGYNRIRY